jgi:primosomal protein N' (replication factor Y)
VRKGSRDVRHGPEDAEALLVARVLPDLPALEREFDYIVPAELAGQVGAGMVVRVPLQGRRVRGWVTAYPVTPAAGLALRPIAKVTGWGPSLELVDLASWAAWRWAGRRRAFLVTATPPVAVRNLPPPARASGDARASERTGTSAAQPGRAIRQPGRAMRTAPRAARAEAARALVERAIASGPGTHLLRLPPDHDATEVVVALARRGPVLVAVPSEERATAGAATLRHRGLGVAQVPGEWAQARSGADVVIGSRGAAWAPCPEMAAAVIFDAHDEGYVQGTSPTWDAANVLAERARRAGAVCVWVSACPTLDMLAARPRMHLPSRSEERAGWAPLQVVDLRLEDPRAGLFSRALVRLLHEGGRVVCVLNRKGRAALVACDACRELARCEQCGAAVAWLGKELRCRRCGASRPEVCASCGSDTLRTLRLGVTAAALQVAALAGRPTAEVTEKAQAVPGEPVLVGTEAVLFRERGLRATGGVDAVAFLDFDQELLAPRYRAAEEAIGLLARASRLVEGRRRGGRVLVQTRTPAHPVVKAALLADPGLVPSAEEPVRRVLRLPPYSSTALLSGPGARLMATDLVVAAAGGVELDGPDGSGRFLVRAPDHARLADALAACPRPRERVRVEVGPARL